MWNLCPGDRGQGLSMSRGLWTVPIEELEQIPDACAERFPFELIEELKRDYSWEHES